MPESVGWMDQLSSQNSEILLEPGAHQEPVDILEGRFEGERSPHSAYLDSITEQTIDQWDKGVDLLVREMPQLKTRVKNSEPAERRYRNPLNRDRGIDILMIDTDGTIAVYERKPTSKEALQKLEIWRDESLEPVMEETEIDYTVTGHDIRKHNINEGYKSPSQYPKGVYASEESLDNVLDSPQVLEFLDKLYGGTVETGEELRAQAIAIEDYQ